ncbi:MAG: hypothetical protein KDC53_10980 [Saprospiraceae bacterium]|nr:hypothetical protein [Saprospiraceae bacterium]
MCKKAIKLLTILVATLGHFCAMAQNEVDSPYSRFGLGDLYSDQFVPTLTMGGIGAAYSDLYQTNLSNPASLAALQATSFELGLDVSYSKLKVPSTNESTSYLGGNLNYFSLAFPVINPVNRLLDRKSQDFNWSMGIALLPYSRVNHYSRREREIDNIGRVREEIEGSGGLNKVVWSHGVKYKKLYAGVSLGYLFGTILKEKSVLYRDLPLAFDNYSFNEASYRGFLLKSGLQYEFDLSNGKGAENIRDVKMITVGLSSTTGTRFRTLSTDFVALKGVTFQGLADEFPQNDETDTISYQTDIERSGKLSGDLSLGLVYRKGARWLLGFNTTFINGNKYENELSTYKLKNAFYVGAGFQYTPDYISYNSYWKRVMYRAGIQIGTDPRVINDEQIKQFSLNAGIGLPVVVSRQLSFINLGLNYGNHSGNIPIKESVLGFSVGVTLNNNLWFLKRKFD